MNKFLIISFILMTIPLFSYAQKQNHQPQQVINALKKKINSSNAGNNAKRRVIRLDASKVTDIEIYKDENMSSTGDAYHINIGKKSVVRHAGEWDGMCGVIDTYYIYDSTYFTRAINAINKCSLLLVANRKPLISPKGTTQIIICQGDETIYNLIVSPQKSNVQGNFFKLVEELVEMTGGEPEFGGPLTDGTEIIDIDDNSY